MALPNVDKLSYKELLQLQTKIAATIDKRKSDEKNAVKRKMMEMAAASGFELDELVGSKRGVRKGSTVAPKFRHPKDPTLTWTGRGRQPKWLAAELAKGKKLESFAI
jgi:DNA-binding protein H-NS